MVTDLGVRGTGKPAKDVDRARATPMGKGLCTRALCKEKGTAPLLGAQGHQAHTSIHICTELARSDIHPTAKTGLIGTTHTQTLMLMPARLPKGSKQDVSGSHTYTHRDMRATDAHHTYLALPLLLVELGLEGATTVALTTFSI